MLELVVHYGEELYDEEKEQFVPSSSLTVRFEHSLFTISKWEERWHVPFLDVKEKTEEQMIDYIRCMVIEPERLPDDFVYSLTSEQVTKINDYISDEATATTVHTFSPSRSRQQIFTSEVLYVQMFARKIPMDCEHWHLNRLLMLLRVWDIYNADPNSSKMSKKQAAALYAQQNAKRRQQMHSKG